MVATLPPASATTCPVTAYARSVVDGERIAGELVRLACQRHLDDLAAAESHGWRWNQAEAERVIAIFRHLPQGKGRWAGKPLELLPWQQFVVGSVFGWQLWDATLGRWVRRFREAYVSVARKNGKSTVCAGVGLILLDYDEEPGAEVYAIASKRDQAKQVWDAAAQMVAQSPTLRRRIEHLASTSRLVVRDTGSRFLPLGRDSDSEHGLNPSGAIIDELHVHANRSMVDAIETAIGARTQPLIFYITTAGVEGESIYVETDDRARRVVRGIVDDPRMFAYVACPDEGDDWRLDAETYFAKGNPSLGHTVQPEELIAERDKALSTPGRQASFRRLRGNERTSEETVWIDLAEWDACEAEELARTGRRHVGVDLGGRRDLSAAVVLTMDDQGGFDVEERYWMPEEAVQEAEERDQVPYRAWIDAGYIRTTPGAYRDDEPVLEDLYEIVQGGEVDYDGWQAGHIFTQLDAAGVTTVKVPQTFAELGPATDHLEQAISKRTMTHLRNPVTRWMLANCTVEENRDGTRKPSKMTARLHRKHIDGISALVTALAGALKADPVERSALDDPDFVIPELR